MRRLAQFVRLRASRVCLASVVLSRVCASASVLRLSRVCLASACICLACVSRLSASVHVKGSECVRLRLRLSRVCLASVVLSRVCLRLFTSRVPNACVCVCVCLASVSRRSSCLASVRLHLSCVCLASVVLSRICLASVVLSRVCLSPCECLRELAHFMSVVIQRVQKVFAIVILSYNVPMPKYPSHHLIYVFYHPMPIMPLY